jgi:uncharacterized protein YfaQ (DUF2300 family)
MPQGEACCGFVEAKGRDTLMFKMTTPAAVAIALSLAAFSSLPADAAVAPAQLVKPAADAGVVKVQNRDGIRRKEIRRRSFNRGYRAGSRHAHPPRGWRRYDRRPGDWRTRGCVIVGPLWFCP